MKTTEKKGGLKQALKTLFSKTKRLNPCRDKAQDHTPVTLIIDGHTITIPRTMTIMQAAETVGIHIPRLCYHPDLSIEGACRVCIVKVVGTESLMISCSTKVKEGMVVKTHSPEVRQARRDIVELILDNHPRDCQTCERDGRCELQNLAYTLGVRERLFAGERKRYPLEKSSHSVVRDAEKCILCGRCVRVCSEVQGICNLSQHRRGFKTIVTPAYGACMDDSVCVQCGQCINVCPTAALQEKRHTDRVFRALADPRKLVVVQTAPSIRAAIGEDFGLPPGTPCTGKMVAALRRLGFDVIFDTDLGADFTIMEEAHELIRRIKNKGPLPLLTSCSSGWINFMEKFYPELIPYASSCRSPMSMISALTKTYYAKKIHRKPQDIYVVAVMPCVAKKYEIERPELVLSGMPITDAVLTTRELSWMIKNYGIDFNQLPDEAFDAPLGQATGAGVIFGTTGGVMEAMLRTTVELMSGKTSNKLEFEEVRAVEGLCEKTLRFKGGALNIGIANGLVNAKTLLNKVISGQKSFHVIELMACPGGCIGGGGQPYPPEGYHVLDPCLLAKRAQAIYQVDTQQSIRRAHQNPILKQLYAEFLGQPGSKVARRLLHTQYSQKEPRGVCT